MEQLKATVDQCTSDYDQYGWTAPDLVNPNDINIFAQKS